MSISIKPLEDRIVVQTVEAEQTTASGLVIPDTAKEKPQEGKVVAVGPGRVDDSGNRVPVDVAEGDVVIYSKYGAPRSATPVRTTSSCRPATSWRLSPSDPLIPRAPHGAAACWRGGTSRCLPFNVCAHICLLHVCAVSGQLSGR